MTTAAQPTIVPDDDPAIDVPLDGEPEQAPTEAAAPAAAEDTAKTKRLTAAAASAGDSFRNWWGFVRQPMSVAEAWHRSDDIDPRRIPDRSRLLAALWHWSNRTDRILLFLLILVLPTFLNGPLLWCVVRPTRRWGLYLVVFIMFRVVRAMGNG